MIETSQVRYLRTSTTTQVTNILVHHRRPSCSSRKKSVRWKDNLKKVMLESGWERVPNWNCLFVLRKKGLCSSVYVDDFKMSGRKQNMAPKWKKLVELVDLDESTSFFDHVPEQA